MHPFSETPKQAGKTIIKQAAEHLILTYGETTTLEVKIWLRQKGYFAKQVEVSMWMHRLSQEMDWDFEFNGRNRVYKYKVENSFSSSLDLPAFSLN